MENKLNYLVLMRHGQSQWNLENRFAGWSRVKSARPQPYHRRRAFEFNRRHCFPTVDAAVGALSSVIEPVMIVVLGGMVGMIAVSVFGPMTQISNVAGG